MAGWSWLDLAGWPWLSGPGWIVLANHACSYVGGFPWLPMAAHGLTWLVLAGPGWLTMAAQALLTCHAMAKLDWLMMAE